MEITLVNRVFVHREFASYKSNAKHYLPNKENLNILSLPNVYYCLLHESARPLLLFPDLCSTPASTPSVGDHGTARPLSLSPDLCSTPASIATAGDHQASMPASVSIEFEAELSDDPKNPSVKNNHSVY
jgi:hypothetical protein